MAIPAAPPRPNVLWLMSDQHHADAAGFAGHPLVRTPNLDRVAERGVRFSQAFCNNPICSPSRICFITGQYAHTHRLLGNAHAMRPDANHDTLATVFRRHGYQTALIGKSHMTRRWDEDGFEFLRYTDLCDAHPGDPRTTHYFAYLDDLGLADWYEEGSEKPGQSHALDGSKPAALPYEHSIERYTGDQTLAFLRSRDTRRPFLVKMSFQRPHSPITPAAKHFDLYDPADVPLPESADDWFERKFAGKPKYMQAMLARGCGYPLASESPERLKRCLASYFALIERIDAEIGRVLDHLEMTGDLANTVVVYVADHGDFAGDHGLFHKNFGIYESIHRIPFLLSYPGGPAGERRDGLVESIDLFPTLCDLCDVPRPGGLDGESIVPVAEGTSGGKAAAWCEWEWMNPAGKISAIRTADWRGVVYEGDDEGELYDRRVDPGEVNNLWHDPAHRKTRSDLIERLLRFTLGYATATDHRSDRVIGHAERLMPRPLVHQGRRYWSRLRQAYDEPTTWPPAGEPVAKDLRQG